MNTFSKTVLATCTIAGAIAFSGLAQASPMKVDLTFPAFSDLFPEDHKATTITYSNGTTTKTAHVAAGMFGGAASNGVNFTPSTLYRGADNVLAYCIDIMKNLLSSGTYDVRSIGQSQVVDPAGVRRDFGRMLSFLGAANHVATTKHALTFGDLNWLNPNGHWMSAAIQVGIWEALYEKADGPLSIASGDSGYFSATTLGGDGDMFLSDAFSAMGDNEVGALDAGKVKWMQIDGGQDLIVDPVDVPAPASILLLLSGLGILSYRRGNSTKV